MADCRDRLCWGKWYKQARDPSSGERYLNFLTQTPAFTYKHKFRTEDPQTLGTTTQNLVTWRSWRRDLCTTGIQCKDDYCFYGMLMPRLQKDSLTFLLYAFMTWWFGSDFNLRFEE